MLVVLVVPVAPVCLVVLVVLVALVLVVLVALPVLVVLVVLVVPAQNGFDPSTAWCYLQPLTFEDELFEVLFESSGPCRLSLEILAMSYRIRRKTPPAECAVVAVENRRIKRPAAASVVAPEPKRIFVASGNIDNYKSKNCVTVALVRRWFCMLHVCVYLKACLSVFPPLSFVFSIAYFCAVCLIMEVSMRWVSLVR